MGNFRERAENVDGTYSQLVKIKGNDVVLDKNLDSVSAEIIDGKIEAAYDVVPNDSANVAFPTTFIYVGGTGDLKVDLTKGGTVTFKSLPIGFHKICVKKVYVTGTTATNIVGVYHV